MSGGLDTGSPDKKIILAQFLELPQSVDRMSWNDTGWYFHDFMDQHTIRLRKTLFIQLNGNFPSWMNSLLTKLKENTFETLYISLNREKIYVNLQRIFFSILTSPFFYWICKSKNVFVLHEIPSCSARNCDCCIPRTYMVKGNGLVEMSSSERCFTRTRSLKELISTTE